MFQVFVLLTTLTAVESTSLRLDNQANEVAVMIDVFAEKHWLSVNVTPTETVDDAGFLRRVTLDLAGRVPTYDEARAFADQSDLKRRTKVINRLIDSLEFALHFGNVFDQIIQGKHAGDRAFVEYLRRSFQEGKSWDNLFRELLVGPWSTDEQKSAKLFLKKRVQQIDELTNDTSRVFFGVDISCAKCHDHPLVFDWTQDHYYGLASFFKRTYEFGDNKEIIGEKDDGEVTFVDVDGESHTAQLMFLSGKVVTEPLADTKFKMIREHALKQGNYMPPDFRAREQLVEAGLRDSRFFSRAIVNRIWAYLLGQGLVHPVEQMHSENPSSISGLLEWLAEDLVQSGYDLRRLVKGIVSSRVYQKASVWRSSDRKPDLEHFAVAQLRPLSRKQFALSMVLAAGTTSHDQAKLRGEVDTSYRQMEERSQLLIGALDDRSDRFQSSTGEALFMSNNDKIQSLVQNSKDNLVSRLTAIESKHEMIEMLCWTVLCRAPKEEETEHLLAWFKQNEDNPVRACENLVWAMISSAEFRFNH